jgi:hypothetical protein
MELSPTHTRHYLTGALILLKPTALGFIPHIWWVGCVVNGYQYLLQFEDIMIYGNFVVWSFRFVIFYYLSNPRMLAHVTNPNIFTYNFNLATSS